MRTSTVSEREEFIASTRETMPPASGQGVIPHVKDAITGKRKHNAIGNSVPTSNKRVPPVNTQGIIRQVDNKAPLSLSITITRPGGDISFDAWEAIATWMRDHTLMSAFGLERGDAEFQLHAQGVAR